MQRHQNKRRSGKTRIIVASVLFILVGAGIMLYPKMTDLRYALAQSNLEAAAESGQGGGMALPDGAVALLEIPAIDFRAYVLEGTDRSTLAKAPGHYPDTPLPGEPGNSAIAGHRTTHGHAFHDLDLLEPGDQIITTTADCTAVYRVVQVVAVDPTDLGVIAQTGPDRLTLTTCHPEGSARQRLVVVAELTG
jgi:sortase A